MLSTIGNGIDTGIQGIGNGIDWTLRNVGNSVMYTACTGAKVVKNVTAGVAVGLGYPIATISGVIAVASGIYCVGPCTAYSHLPDLGTVSGFAKMALSPTDTTVQIADAALCPAALSTCMTAAAVTLVSYTIARCARRAFN